MFDAARRLASHIVCLAFLGAALIVTPCSDGIDGKGPISGWEIGVQSSNESNPLNL